jgi:2-C-methyl-D-erythritol 4-phosphate cytidylyltransferase/2-C-methyl-D-erythritol 2,4-cyclodiphosphate synthase
MASASPTPPAATPFAAIIFAAIVVAAGRGLRAGQAIPKQFAPYRGSTVLAHAVEALLAAGAGPVAVAIPPGEDAAAAACLAALPPSGARVTLVPGGATRQQSVRAALEALAPADPARVLIHDAARPDCPPEVVARLLAALARHPAAIPVLPVIDSLALAAEEAGGAVMAGSAPRGALRRVQTPQAFRFPAILAAHRQWSGAPDAGDDAQVARAAGLTVALVAGDERLRKLTLPADFAPTASASASPASPPPQWPRTGTGFDVHRLAAGEELWLCGILVPHDRGLAGHSDADVALHAVVDAILGACADGDIGQHFPPGDPQWRGARSACFVEHAVARAAARGYAIGNVDLTLICEAPKIGPHRDAMRARLAELLMVGVEAVSVKATTTERLGFAGRQEGIAAQAVATLVPAERPTERIADR